MTTLIQPLTKKEKIALVIGRFHYRNWRSTQVDRYADVYMVYLPSRREHCYFIAFTSDDKIKVLPEETTEGYNEAKAIIKEALNGRN